VLAVPPTATAAEIRDAYRRLISQYHPDKVNNLGQEFRDLATRKSQEITAAYAEAMRERGEQP
jgi:DnaJ-domain-containing protein 1